MRKTCFALVIIVAIGSVCSAARVYPPEVPAVMDGYSDYKPDIQPAQLGKTWVEIDGEVYGAKPNDEGPIGGSAGYKKIVKSGDYVTSTVESLMGALQQAKPGQTIFIPGNVALDLTSWMVGAQKVTLDIPAGVTLASDRGENGSWGALIFSTEMRTHPLIRVANPNVRITGLRLRGPDPLTRFDLHKRAFEPGGGGSKLYYKTPNSIGIVVTSSSLEVDNCELMGWSDAAMNLDRGKDHRIHHNYIHHNRRHGLGYGACTDRAFAAFEYNLYDYNRHHIAGTGRPGSGYEAANNVVLMNGNSHLFDMHGGRDRKDGTTIAGTWMKMHHNTFMHPTERTISIRGIPEESAEIHHNWIYRPYEEGIGLIKSDGKTSVHDNVYGNPPKKVANENYPFEK